MTAVHNNTGSVYKYELPRNRSSFCVQFLYFFAMKQQKWTSDSFDINSYVINVVHAT